MYQRFLLPSAAAAFIAALVLADAGDAQPQFKKGKKGGPFTPGATADSIVERIMSFDKNGDGKITADELPERMQHLIALGDTNKDGALDQDEIRKLATTLEAFVGIAGGPQAKGDGPKDFKGGFKGQKGGSKSVDEAFRALDDLNVTGKTRDRADRVLRGAQDKFKKFEESLRTDIVVQMKDVLTEEDYRGFKAAMDRPPFDPPFRDGPKKKKGPPPGDR